MTFHGMHSNLWLRLSALNSNIFTGVWHVRSDPFRLCVNFVRDRSRIAKASEKECEVWGLDFSTPRNIDACAGAATADRLRPRAASCSLLMRDRN